MTQKEFITKIESLKQIKPREEWVILTKSNILKDTNSEIILPAKFNYAKTLSNIFNVYFQRKFTYALAVFLVLIVGTTGIVLYGFPNSSGNTEIEKTKPLPIALVEIKNNVEEIKENIEELKIKSQNLSDIAKRDPENVHLAAEEVKEVAENLTEAIAKDPELAKVVALEVSNNKTYLDISGEESDLQETIDGLHRVIVEQLIKDFDNMELTENYRQSVSEIKDSLNNGEYEGEYAKALEDTLLINTAIENDMKNDTKKEDETNESEIENKIEMNKIE